MGHFMDFPFLKKLDGERQLYPNRPRMRPAQEVVPEGRSYLTCIVGWERETAACPSRRSEAGGWRLSRRSVSFALLDQPTC